MWTKNRYPDNWQEIATGVKERADWKCQCCGLQCLRPDEDASKLTLSERSIRKLAVHHHNRQPEDNRPENLIALCSACHLDRHKFRHGSVPVGQLSLF